ncbi:CarD family transcriptional regulator [Bradyrhizobium sp. WD16]|nr:CarD family transcriptional regulator [Bradyrhizobium sp. WD16]UTD26676.1 CarD family transcriptional regulator [Bradyrhizobium sp. WD16]
MRKSLTGAWRFHAQVVASKTRNQSTKSAKKASAPVRGAAKSHAKGSHKAPRASASKTTAHRAPVKAAPPKSSKSRSEMPKTTAKTAKAAGTKAPATKVTATKAPVTKVQEHKVQEAKAPVAKAPVAKAPVASKAPAVKPAVAAKPVAKAPAAPRVEEPKKPLTQRQGFKTNEFVVYPAHGVGQILSIEEQEIAGAKLELFVINFIKDKMTLRVPTAKVAQVGMRKLSEPALVKKALETLKGRARIKRTMWSRRAQEYEAKINSGDIVAIAEVVRDLYRSESQPEQSYSERQLYEAALDRLSREIAVVQHVTETEAIKEIEASLAKSPRRGAAKAEAESDGESDADDNDGEDSVAEDEAA